MSRSKVTSTDWGRPNPPAASGAVNPPEGSGSREWHRQLRGVPAELARLQPLPRLLARVPLKPLRADGQPVPLRERAPVTLITKARNTRARKARGPAGRWRRFAGVAAAAALGAAGGFWLAQPAASSPPVANTLSGANPVTHVRVTLELTGTSWGTSILLRAWACRSTSRAG